MCEEPLKVALEIQLANSGSGLTSEADSGLPVMVSGLLALEMQGAK